MERDRLHQLKGAAARAETRTEDAGGFVGLIDATEAKTIANRSVTKQRIELEMKQFIESDPELFGHGAAFALADSPLKKKREAYLLKIEMELKEEGMLNKVGEDFAGLTNEEAAAQIESIKLGGVEVSIEGEETRKTKTMPDSPVENQVVTCQKVINNCVLVYFISSNIFQDMWIWIKGLADAQILG